MSRLITGLLLYGGLGFLGGQWLGVPALGLAIGSMIGMALALYLSHMRVAAMDDGPLPLPESSSPMTWSRRMTQVRMREAREQPNGQ